MFKILTWKNSKDVELKALIEDSKLKYITKIMDDRGLTWKTEDYAT
jgi:hypothetical protein